VDSATTLSAKRLIRPTVPRLIRSTVPSPNRAALLFPAHGTVPYTVLINASTYFRWAPPTLGCPTILICLYTPYYQHSHVRQQHPFCCPSNPRSDYPQFSPILNISCSLTHTSHSFTYAENRNTPFATFPGTAHELTVEPLPTTYSTLGFSFPSIFSSQACACSH
jgi:hypothetical protein